MLMLESITDQRPLTYKRERLNILMRSLPVDDAMMISRTINAQWYNLILIMIL